jgi:hypothetical protein
MTKDDENTKSKKAAIQKSSSNVGRKKGAGTGLNDLFIAVFGIGFILSCSLNIMYMMGYDSTTNNGGSGDKNDKLAGSAMHKAMQDFKKHSVTLDERKQKLNEKNLKSFFRTNAKQQEQDEDEDHGIDNDHDNELPKEMGHHDDDNNDGLMELATLDCKAYGGPSQDVAQEMVYWSEIPLDSLYVSPFYKANQKMGGQRKYATFEPDGGGWNNIRMAMESTIAIATAMGRTLVMPPQKKMYLLGKQDNRQRHHFSFVDFFPIEEMAKDNEAFSVVSMKEYLETEGMKGNLINQVRGSFWYDGVSSFLHLFCFILLYKIHHALIFFDFFFCCFVGHR